jgi:hypothetical protein
MNRDSLNEHVDILRPSLFCQTHRLDLMYKILDGFILHITMHLVIQIINIHNLDSHQIS